MQVMHISAVSEIHNRLLPSLEMLRARPWRAHVCWQTLTQPAKRLPPVLHAQMTVKDARVLLVPIKKDDVTQNARPKLEEVACTGGDTENQRRSAMMYCRSTCSHTSEVRDTLDRRGWRRSRRSSPTSSKSGARTAWTPRRSRWARSSAGTPPRCILPCSRASSAHFATGHVPVDMAGSSGKWKVTNTWVSSVIGEFDSFQLLGMCCAQPLPLRYLQEIVTLV